jgi:hypothetical protein
MTKTIDVTLASMRNAGDLPVSPKGVIRAAITRAADDENIREVEALYLRVLPGEPMHPSGATGIAPGKSLTFNVTKRLTVKGDEDGDGHPDEMLIFSRDLEESELEKYQGSFNRKVRFDEIDGFTTVSCDYNVVRGGGITKKIIATYTVNLISG